MHHSHFTRGVVILASLSLAVLAGCQSITAPGSTAGGTPTPTLTGTPGTPGATPAPTATGSPGSGAPYASLLFADSTQGGALNIENLNPTSGRHVVVALVAATDQVPRTGIVISPDGQTVAYAQVDAGGATSLFAANIAGLSAPQLVTGPSTGTFSNPVWQHDNTHLAVVSGRQILIFSKTGQTTGTLQAPPTASLVGFSPDDQSLFVVTTGDAQGLVPGALYRVPVGDAAHPMQISPRENGSHFVLSSDGQTAYFDNTASSGAAGIYSVGAQSGGTPRLIVPGAGNYPLGSGSGGSLFFAAAQTTNPALKRVDASGTVTTVVAQLVTAPAEVRFPIQDIALAPDGTGVAVVTPLATTGSEVFYIDLTASTPAPKVALSLPSATRLDLLGWDTSLVAAGS